jgi:hypothetical protein
MKKTKNLMVFLFFIILFGKNGYTQEVTADSTVKEKICTVNQVQMDADISADVIREKRFVGDTLSVKTNSISIYARKDDQQNFGG